MVTEPHEISTADDARQPSGESAAPPAPPPRRGGGQLLIVGAGPTGLALACRCTQLGLDTRLIDRKAGPTATSNAIGLQYRISELLAAMGVVDRFIQESCTPSAVNLYLGERKLLQVGFHPELGDAGAGGAFQPCSLLIPQSRTEALLGDFLRELGGRAVEWSTELVEHTQSAGSVQARLRHASGAEEEWRGSWLVSCEGAHSRIRAQAGIEFRGQSYAQHFLLADFDLGSESLLAQSEVSLWLHPQGSVALMPLPTMNVWRFFAEITAPAWHGEPSQAEIWGQVQEVLSQRVPHAERFAAAQPRWASQFRIHRRLADHFRRDRVFLAGDAAHLHSFTGGQGIATGIQDAFNLAWKLARVSGGAADGLLDTYEEERRPQAQAVLRQTDQIIRLFTATRPPASWIREWLVLPILRLPSLQKRFFGRFAQLHVSYRGTRLAVDETSFVHRAVSGCRSGDRTPDVALRHAETGNDWTLLNALRLGRPVVLLGTLPDSPPEIGHDALLRALDRLEIESYRVVAADSPPASDRTRVLIDVHGDWRRLYPLHGDFLCLVRPDAHLGLIQQHLDIPRLRRYLRSLCSEAAVVAAFAGLGAS
ncbi:MAG TPA: FAD-dependent monooxygenase [Thermoanaerobaculia bacterium]|nr:FAD-dependent monooxygenase [Thermoanaerobaculia bacterium]